MKSLFTALSLLFVLLFTGCKVNEEPVFVQLNKIKIKKANLKIVEFEAEAVFENPNIMGGDITSKDLNVFIGDMQVGTILPTKFNVPAEGEFTMPLNGSFYTKNIIKKDGKLLDNIFGALKDKKVNLSLKGDLVFKKGPIEYVYNMNETQEVNIKF